MIGSSIVGSQEDGLDKLAKHARIVLVVIAAVQLGSAALLWVAGGAAMEALVLPSVVVAVVYGLLAVWARRAPMPAVIVGLVIYVGGVVLSVMQGGGLLDGLLFKVILLALFLNGLGSARQFEQAKQRLASSSGSG